MGDEGWGKDDMDVSSDSITIAMPNASHIQLQSSPHPTSTDPDPY
jgi:hypothetical protein